MNMNQPQIIETKERYSILFNPATMKFYAQDDGKILHSAASYAALKAKIKKAEKPISPLDVPENLMIREHEQWKIVKSTGKFKKLKYNTMYEFSDHNGKLFWKSAYDVKIGDQSVADQFNEIANLISQMRSDFSKKIDAQESLIRWISNNNKLKQK